MTDRPRLLLVRVSVDLSQAFGGKRHRRPPALKGLYPSCDAYMRSSALVWDVDQGSGDRLSTATRPALGASRRWTRRQFTLPELAACILVLAKMGKRRQHTMFSKRNCYSRGECCR